MKLFEDKHRDNYKRASFGENLYNFYDTNEQTHIVEVRELLNKWFENYPDDYKQNLQNDFKNKFHDAFHELFIHETFYRQGFTLTPHPKLPNSTRKPDFLAAKNGKEIYIEATTVSYLSDLEIKKENFKENFLEELNKMSSPNFWLGLKELEFKKDNFPKVGNLRKGFEQELSKLDPEELQNKEKSRLASHDLKYEDNDLKIVVTLFVKSEAAKQASDFRTIGIQMSPVTIKDASNDADKILKSFIDKSKRYGELDKPFIICLKVDFNFNLKYDVDWAFSYSNGFNSRTPKFTKVSAVLVTQVTEGNIFNFPGHRFIINKHSKNPVNMEHFDLSFEDQDNEILKKDLNEILNLNGRKPFGIKF